MLIPVLSLINCRHNPPEEPGVGGSFVVLSEDRYKFGAVTRISRDQPLQIAGRNFR
jgi:hypothetical protein